MGVHFVSHGKSSKKELFSFEDMKQNVKDAITYSLNEFKKDVILMGTSQGGVLVIAVAGEDHRIKAVFPHNILLTDLPESIEITRFPNILKHVYKPVINMMGAFGKVFPRLKLPVTAYLSFDRISKSEEIKMDFYNDECNLKYYPLYFLVSLFQADMSKITDGSINCRVVVVASTLDPLFSFKYTEKVYNLIKALYKEILTIDESYHLIFNECVEQILDPICEKLDGI